MNNKPFLLGLCIFILPLVSALPSIDQTSNLSATVFRDNPSEYSFMVTNIGSEILYNYTCDNKQFLFFPTIDTIGIDESKNFTFTILTTQELIAAPFTTNCHYYYMAMQSLPQKNWQILYENNTFNPYETEISQGDSIQVINNGTATIDIKTINDTIPQFNVDSNSISPPITISNIQNYLFYNLFTGSTFNIYSKERTRLLPQHSPDYDKPLTITLDSIFQRSNLKVDLMQSDFSMNPYETKEGVLKIENIGSYPAINIILSMDWANFTYLGLLTAHFNLNPDEARFINFQIKSNLTKTEETNQTYFLIMRTSSSNTDLMEKTVNVTIPYMNLSQFVYSSSGVNYVISVPVTIQYCHDYPNDTQCTPLYTNFTRMQIVPVQTPCIYNSSEAQTETLFNRFMAVVNAQFSSMNKNLSDTLSDISAIKGGVSSINANTKSAEQVRADFDLWTDLGSILLALIIIIAIGAYVNHKSKKDQAGKTSNYF